MVPQPGKTLLLEVPDEVVRRACQNDVLAVAALYDHYQPRLYRYLVARLEDLPAAQDLTAEVFLRMVRALPSYQIQQTPFSAWLFQIARNLLKDHFRWSRSRQDCELIENVPDGRANLETQIEYTIEREQLYQALAALPDEQGDVLSLRFLAGLPIAETAQVMGKSEDAIKGLQRRALIGLRQVLTNSEALDV